MKLTQKTQAHHVASIIAVFFFAFGVSSSMAGLFEKSSLGSPWKELFADVAKLNEYQQQGHTVELQNTRIENYDLAGARFDKAKFEDTDWKSVTAKGATFSNTTFRNCKLDQVRFEEATLKDVTFDNCELSKVSFFHAQLPGVRFINSTLKDKTTFQASTSGNITFDHATMKEVSFYKAQAVIAVRDSKINDGDFTTMQPPSSLTFEKSELKEVNFERSILERFVLNHVKADMGGTSGGRINVVEIRDSQFGFSFSETQIDSFTVSKSTIETALNSATVKSIEMSDCQGMKNMTLYMAKIERMRIQNCHLNDFALVKATVDEFSVTNAKLTKNQFMNSKIKTMTLENISLDGKVDFTNAHIDQLTTKNITKLPGLNLITTGSNVKFE